MKCDLKTTQYALAGIVLLGALLRFSGLGNNAFVSDEFLDINSSYGYAQTGEWKAWDFNHDQPASMNINDARDERAVLYKWQVAQMIRIFGPTETIARSVSALWGIFSIVLLFWTGWFYSKKKEIGLLAAFLFAVAMSGVVFDRRLRMYAMFYPMYLAFATALFAAFEVEYVKKRVFFRTIWQRYGINAPYFAAAAILGALSFNIHQLSIAIVPTLGAYAVWEAYGIWRRGEGIRNKYVTVFGVGMVVVLVGILVSPLIRSALFGGVLTWFENHYSYFGHVFSDFSSPLMGMVAVLSGIGTLAFRFNRKKEAAYLSIAFFTPLVMSVWLWNRNVGPQYIFFAQSFALLLAASGIWGGVSIAQEYLSGQFGKKAIWIALIVPLIVFPNYGYFLSENNTYHETSSGDNPNYRKVFSFVKKHQAAGDALITRNFRNYYWAGAKIAVYDFGGELSESKLSTGDIRKIMVDYPSGWVVLSGNDYDYISKDAEALFHSDMERISNPYVRGDIEVYHWGVTTDLGEPK
jgi:hypothetical protein